MRQKKSISYADSDSSDSSDISYIETSKKRVTKADKEKPPKKANF